MVAVQLSLPWTVCIACSLFIPVLALPSFHKRTFSPTTPEKRSTVPLTNIITSPTVLIAENGTSSTNFLPACWPDFPSPAPKAPPITNPRDCGEAIRHMINEGRATEPVVWFAQRDWTYNSCAIFLIPAGGIRTPRDTFSRLEIAREASAIQMACANGAHGYRGGVVPIGVGIFEVALVGRPTTLGLEESWQVELANETALEKRALPLQGLPQLSAPSSLPAKANSPASTSKHPVTSLGWSPDCWSYYPPPGGHDPTPLLATVAPSSCK